MDRNKTNVMDTLDVMSVFWTASCCDISQNFSWQNNATTKQIDEAEKLCHGFWKQLADWPQLLNADFLARCKMSKPGCITAVTK